MADTNPPSAPLNKVRQAIEDTGHLRWLNPTGKFFWFIGGETDNPEVIARMKYRLVRDMHTLGSGCMRRKQLPVALISPTQIQPLAVQLLRSMQGWRKIVLGEGALNMDPGAINRLCLNTADTILCYGPPSESLSVALDEMENGPELVIRNMEGYGRERQSLLSPEGLDGQPYSRFRADVTRLSRVRVSPTRGLQVRDEIDMRPKMDV